MLNDAGHIDRKKLAAVVFNDPAALRYLNEITHPAINRAVGAEVAALKAEGYRVVVIEAPLLVEAGWTRETDVIWLTEAPPEVVLRRLVEKMGYTEDEGRARIAVQTSNEERRRYASEIIDTDTSLEELRDRVTVLWRSLKVNS